MHADCPPTSTTPRPTSIKIVLLGQRPYKDAKTGCAFCPSDTSHISGTALVSAAYRWDSCGLTRMPDVKSTSMRSLWEGGRSRGCWALNVQCYGNSNGRDADVRTTVWGTCKLLLEGIIKQFYAHKIGKNVVFGKWAQETFCSTANTTMAVLAKSPRIHFSSMPTLDSWTFGVKVPEVIVEFFGGYMASKPTDAYADPPQCPSRCHLQPEAPPKLQRRTGGSSQIALAQVSLSLIVRHAYTTSTTTTTMITTTTTATTTNSATTSKNNRCDNYSNSNNNNSN